MQSNRSIKAKLTSRLAISCLHVGLRGSDTFYFNRLSRREQEVLVWVAQALTDDEIGMQLALAPSTVQTHRSENMRKLDLHTTPKLVRYGIELGLGIGEVYHGLKKIRTREPSPLD